MSRYEFKNQRYVVTIGWDSPLNTFFATVFDLEWKTKFDEPLIWLGTQVSEYPHLGQFLNVLEQEMKAYGVVDVVLSSELSQILQEAQRFEGKGFAERQTEIKQFVLANKKL